MCLVGCPCMISSVSLPYAAHTTGVMIEQHLASPAGSGPGILEDLQ